MKKCKKDSGYIWYIHALNAEVDTFISWGMPESKNIASEKRRDQTGKAISAFRVGDIGLVREILARYRRDIPRWAVEIFVRRSPNGPLQPWPTPHKKKKRRSVPV